MKRSTKKLMRALKRERMSATRAGRSMGLSVAKGSGVRRSIAHGIKLRRSVKGAKATRKWYMS